MDQFFFVTSDKAFLLGYEQTYSAREATTGAVDPVIVNDLEAARQILINLPKSARGAWSPITLKTLQKNWDAEWNGRRFVTRKKFPDSKGMPLNKSIVAFLRECKNTPCKDEPEPSPETTPALPQEPEAEPISEETSRNPEFTKLMIHTKTSDQMFAKTIIDALEETNAFVAYMKERRSMAPEELRRIENQILDERHYAENNALNVRDGYAVYKRLHDLYVKRRQLKDELNFLMMASTAFTGLSVEKISQAINFIREQDSRVYNLRDPENFVHTKNVS